MTYNTVAMTIVSKASVIFVTFRYIYNSFTPKQFIDERRKEVKY